MKKIFALLFLGSLLAFSCTDLDDKLYDRIPADEYVADPVLQMSPIYAPMREFVDWGGWWFAQELPGDGVVCPTRDTDWDDGGKWRVLHQHDWNNNTEAVNSMWSRFYRGVVEANKFLETMVPQAGSEVVDIAIAKAKVLRAYYYYLLIDNYGDVPYVTAFTGADEKPRRNPRAQIFEKIVEEMEASIPLIPDAATKTAITKGSAYAIMAKLMLNAEVYTGIPQWEKAEKYCDSIIALNRYSLEADALAPFITNNGSSPEIIWLIPFNEDTYQGFNLHMRTLHYNSNATFDMIAGPWNGFAAQYDHYQSYEDGDRRKEGFLVGLQKDSKGNVIKDPGAGNADLVFDPVIPALVMKTGQHTPVQIRMSGARVVKFEIKKGAKENLSNQFPIFRYADVLLMKSEAMVRQGKNGDAPFNAVRSRAIPGASAISGVTLTQILAERGRELFWEAHRRQDMIRFGTFNQASWEKPASSPDRKIFPIPEWVIESNSNVALDPVPIN